MDNQLQLQVLENGNTDFLSLQHIINKAMSKQNEQLYKEVQRLANEVEATKSELAISKNQSEEQLALERARHRVTESRYGYVSLNDLGQHFTVSIGSKTMGKLLRIVGIAKAKQSRTEPYREYIQDETAKSIMYGDNQTYQWNPEKCIKKIDKWLEKTGRIQAFYSIDNEKQLQQYINKLEEIYN